MLYTGTLKDQNLFINELHVYIGGIVLNAMIKDFFSQQKICTKLFSKEINKFNKRLLLHKVYYFCFSMIDAYLLSVVSET